MVSRPLVFALALVSLVAPAAAEALSLSPRLGMSMVIEDGPPGTDATAYGRQLSAGLGVGVPLLSVVADLGFREASVSSPAGGWTEYATDDTTFTLGLRSKLELLPRIDVAGELHAGRSWADHRAAATEPVDRLGAPDRYWLWGGAGEVSYRLAKRFSLGVRLGIDRFVPTSTEEAKLRSDGGEGEFATDFERTSYTAGLLLGIGL